MVVYSSKKVIERNLADAKIMLIEQLDVNLSIDKHACLLSHICMSMDLTNNCPEHVILLREHGDSYILFHYSFIVYSLTSHDICNIFNRRLKFFFNMHLEPSNDILACSATCRFMRRR